MYREMMVESSLLTLWASLTFSVTLRGSTDKSTAHTNEEQFDPFPSFQLTSLSISVQSLIVYLQTILSSGLLLISMVTVI